MSGTVTVVRRSKSRVLPIGYYEACRNLRFQGFVAAVFVAAWLYIVGRALLTQIMQHLPLTLFCCECIFFAYYCHRYRLLNKQPQVHEPDGHEAMKHFQQFLEYNRSLRGSVDIRRYLSLWFLGTPFEQIKRDNVAELMTYGFWYRSRQAMEARGLGDIPDKMVAAVEQSWDVRFVPGYTPGLKYMGHLWEPLRAFHRPLVFYVITESLSLLARAMVAVFGLKHASHNGVSYYTCNLQHGGTPILLLHGVSLGVVPYVELIKCLVASGQPLIVVEYKHVSMRLTNHIPTACELARSVVGILDELGQAQACVMAHSYGTFVASRLIKNHRQRVASVALVDPVCFGMFMPYLLRSFFYRQLCFQQGLHQVLKHSLLFLVSRDLCCAAAMARRFYWTDLNLWPSELPQESLVVLHGQDELVHVEEVHSVLKAQNVDVMLHPRKGHAEFLLDLRWQDEIVQRVVRLAQGWPQHPPFRSDSAGSYGGRMLGSAGDAGKGATGGAGPGDTGKA